MRNKVLVAAAAVVAGMLLACGSGGDDKGEADGKGNAAAASGGAVDGAGDEPASGVYKFGQTVKFKDGSTLTVGKPESFKRDQYALGGEKKTVFLKFKATFKNNTKEIFDPALTDGAASADGVEGESVYQEGMDAPDNKVLPGKSVTWWMGYGLASRKDVQLEVTVGFLDYGTVIFTG